MVYVVGKCPNENCEHGIEIVQGEHRIETIRECPHCKGSGVVVKEVVPKGKKVQSCPT